MKKSIATLALSVSLLLAHLAGLQAGDYVAAVKAEKILVTSTSWSGEQHSYLKTEKPEVTAMTVDIPSGAETGWHLHTVPVYAYVLSGKLEVELADGKKVTFSQGDALVEVQNVPHNGRNRDSETVRLAVFYTGEAGRANVTRVETPKGR